MALERQQAPPQQAPLERGGAHDDQSCGWAMLSYSWAHQKVFIRLNAALKDKGYRTWIDLEQMRGSTMVCVCVGSAHIVSIVNPVCLETNTTMVVYRRIRWRRA
eukprot:SAG11_NODE_86_length_17300_cov_11.466717_18_plen_104_part_00